MFLFIFRFACHQIKTDYNAENAQDHATYRLENRHNVFTHVTDSVTSKRQAGNEIHQYETLRIRNEESLFPYCSQSSSNTCNNVTVSEQIMESKSRINHMQSAFNSDKNLREGYLQMNSVIINNNCADDNKCFARSDGRSCDLIELPPRRGSRPNRYKNIVDQRGYIIMN